MPATENHKHMNIIIMVIRTELAHRHNNITLPKKLTQKKEKRLWKGKEGRLHRYEMKNKMLAKKFAEVHNILRRDMVCR